MQRHIVRSALEAGVSMDVPGTMSELDLRWHRDDWKADPLGWSRRRDDEAPGSAPAGDTRTGRSSEPQYQADDDRRAAEGIDFDAHCSTCIGLPEPSTDAAH